ncbi:MAG TPA: DUF5615 family PIN-like protein [Acidimicrobiales bacterium]|nr:DUF5615 family PIN-like protein [Acidimicrobiales bacterium]
MKALLDEMIPLAIARQLRDRGRDVVAVAERPDLRSLSDREVFAFAQVEGRAVVTRDRADYLELDREHRATGQTHAGLVLISNRFAPAAVGPLVRALDSFLAGEHPYPGFVHWL